jgi:predicted amidophosphoribosyltransferase
LQTPESMEFNRRQARRSQISHLVSTLLNRCPGCGRAATSFCARCWYVLNHDERGELATRMVIVDRSPFISRALYIWKDELSHSSIIRNAVLASKGSANCEIYRTFSEEVFRRSVAEHLWRERRDWIFVVPPSVRNVLRDHAMELASQLSDLTGNSLPAISVLEVGRVDLTQQKLKSRKDRELKRFSISRTLSPAARARLLGARGYLFLDDVIASGGTAQAAWSALGKPSAFEAWAIAWRSLPGQGVIDRQ